MTQTLRRADAVAGSQSPLRREVTSRGWLLQPSLRAAVVWFGPYAVLAGFMLAGLLLMSAARAMLMWWQWERVDAVNAVGRMLLQGLRSDLITLGACMAPAVVLLPIFLMLRRVALWMQLSRGWLAFAFVCIAFLELVTPQFLIEYDSRPGAMFVQYLAYPHEVSAMLWAGYRGAVLSTVGAVSLLGWGAARYLRRPLRIESSASALRVALLWPLVVVLVVLMIRSSLQHRPANLASFIFCDDAMVNSLVANSAFTVLSAVHAMQEENLTSAIYGEMSKDEMILRVRAEMGTPASDFLSDELPTLHRQLASVRRARPLNLVVVLEESLGAGIVKRLGGNPVTVNLEKLADEGIWFERLYATGTRSIRGIEAVVAGFPPTPAASVVKLPRSQAGFATLASVLGRSGYRSEFVYGGESHFDNMRGFLLGNGFSTVVDRGDFKNPRFVGSWGVSDEDLFAMAHRRIQSLREGGRGFFLLVFTSSNHSPFEYPDGRIEPYDAEKRTVNNAVRYADYALGKFIEQAKGSDYFKDTLFLIVADHDTRVHGSALVPVNKFHIPAVIVGADVQPRRIDSIASQIDLAPTVLSLMGVDAEHPLPGRDLTRTLPEFGHRSGPPPRAVMQYEQSFARLQGETLTVLLANGEVRDFRYDHITERLDAIEPESTELHRQALASVLMPAWIYREQRYGLAVSRSQRHSRTAGGNSYLNMSHSGPTGRR